ncbi:hypothetical protein GYN24_04650 [Lactococcus piscium]|nr:hypothetical protein [Lactococcus paracarnosus]MCJ1993866.1 hypothetical protein [Lactococcus paracarnosus]
MMKSRLKKESVFCCYFYMIGIGGKRYMEKQKTEKEYQQGSELIQSYVTDYLVKKYQGVEKIEWQGIGVKYRNSPILGSSLFGNYVDTKVTIYASENSYFTVCFQLTDETEYDDDAKQYVRLDSLNPEWVDSLFETELRNAINGGNIGDKMDKLAAKTLRKSTNGSPNAKVIYNLEIHELRY